MATPELNARAWWRNQHDARRMMLEYAEYLIIQAREAVLHFAPKPRPDAESGVEPSRVMTIRAALHGAWIYSVTFLAMALYLPLLFGSARGHTGRV